MLAAPEPNYKPDLEKETQNMNKQKFLLSSLGPACAAVLVLAVMLLATPAGVAAQESCSGCAWSTIDTQTCGDPDGTMRCNGVNEDTGMCTQCSWGYAAVPSDLALDGSALISTNAAPELLESMAILRSPGVEVRMSICGSVVTARQYTDEAVARMRQTSATLVFE